MFVASRHSVSRKLRLVRTVCKEVDDARYSLDDGVLRLLCAAGEPLDGLPLGL